MPGINLSEISHLANLSRLELSQGEKERLAVELLAIIDLVDQLGTLKLDEDIAEMPGLDLETLRSDEILETRQQLTLDQLKALAPSWNNESNQLVVPAIFGEHIDE